MDKKLVASLSVEVTQEKEKTPTFWSAYGALKATQARLSMLKEFESELKTKI